MSVSDKNYRDIQTPDDVDNEYVDCCFAQSQPVDASGVKIGVRLFPSDDTPRTFIGCNLVNCEPPPGSTLIRCNTTIITRQSLINTSVIVIDGEEITVGDEIDVIHGKYHQEDGYIYNSEKEVDH